MSSPRGVLVPAAKPPEFRRRAVDLARSGQQPVAKIATDLGISESCLRRWMAQDDVDAGRREGLTSDERRELVELRRRTRVLEMEVEILKRASAYFARENVLPKWVPAGPRAGRRRGSRRADLPGARASPARAIRWPSGAPPSARQVADEVLTATIVRDPPRLAGDLWRAAGPCRAAPRARGGVRPQARGSADAHRGAGRGVSPAQTSRSAALAGAARGPGPAPVHRRPARTGCGARTSPSTPLAPGRSTAPRSWTCSPGRSWGGRSRTTCAPSWSSTPCRWRSGAANRPPARSCTRTAAVHVLDLRPPAARRRPARLDGPGRVIGGQHDDGVVLVDHATRAPGPPAMV